MSKVRIGDLIHRHKELIKVEDDVNYKQVTIRVKHKGVVLRGTQQGSAIGTKNQYVARQGQFILSRIDARQGAFGVVPPELEGAIITNDFWCFDINEERVLRDFFYTLIQAPDFDEACKKASIGTTNRQRINEDFFLNYELEIPPLADQQAAVQQIAAARQHLGQIDNELTHQATLLTRMRQAVLREAVQGRLVPQDATDEPASALLTRIRAEKQRLVKEKRLRADKPLPPLNETEVPYEVPQGWAWCWLGDITLLNPTNRAIDETTASFAPMTAISASYGITPQFEVRKWGDIKKGFTHFADGDVLLAKITPCFENGKGGVAYNLCNGIGAGTTEIYVIRPILEVLPDYINIFLKHPEFVKAAESKMTGSAGQKRVSRETITGAIFPLPPLLEQKRIVAKVAELLTYCAELETELEKAKCATRAIHMTALRRASSVPPIIQPA
jgi:type I restriction enzyme S subunit